MVKDLNNNHETNPGKTEEPDISYSGKHLYIFNSIEEMEQTELKWLAGLSPAEHLQNATSLISRIFSKELEKKPKIGRHIYFE